jgi:integrase/recombinase XerD
VTQVWPDADGKLVTHFVESLKLKHVTTSCAYRSSILKPFQAFVGRHVGERPLDQATIASWLQARCASAPVPRVVRHAQVADQFLRWLVEQGVLSSNPLTELRAAYGISATATLVRAFAGPDPLRQLEALRPPPPFSSHLGPVLQDHVQRMQAAGFRYDPDRFLRFDRFLQSRRGAAEEPLATLIREYAALASTPRGHINRLSVGRVVAAALRRHGGAVPHIPRPAALVREAGRQRLRPYIYTQGDVEHCLRVAVSLDTTERALLRPHTLHLMLLLAYCAGLRRGELLRLRLQDVHDATAEIEIVESKFFKSRRLPLAPGVMEVVRRYLALRRRAGAPSQPDSPLFWNELAGGGYSETCAARWLSEVLRRAGLKSRRGRSGPRVHDLRHTFAMHRLAEWYRRGENVQARMPFLSAYMGHKNVRATLAYITMTPELLEEAGRRFHPLAARVLGGGR